MVLDVDQAARDLAGGRLACPHCGGVLRPWAWAPVRTVRRLDGTSEPVRPRRTRCSSCHTTQVLLPAWCLPRCGDAAEVVGAALAANATGRGHRGIAADLDRPAATVRRWLRRVRGDHAEWLRRIAVTHLARLCPELVADLHPQPTVLGDAVNALAAAVYAYRHRLGVATDAWTLVAGLTGGRLLTPVPAD
ncbi:DUF6431 domain-containing protein [Phytohabitans aurantiacus]|nr:DUF6431 domain-containing protein [Phytohabitans aurantiacus]